MLCKFTPAKVKNGHRVLQRGFYKSICVKNKLNQGVCIQAIYTHMYKTYPTQDEIRIYVDRSGILRCEQYTRNYWQLIFNIKVLSKDSALYSD